MNTKNENIYNNSIKIFKKITEYFLNKNNNDIFTNIKSNINIKDNKKLYYEKIDYINIKIYDFLIDKINIFIIYDYNKNTFDYCDCYIDKTKMLKNIKIELKYLNDIINEIDLNLIIHINDKKLKYEDVYDLFLSNKKRIIMDIFNQLKNLYNKHINIFRLFYNLNYKIKPDLFIIKSINTFFNILSFIIINENFIKNRNIKNILKKHEINKNEFIGFLKKTNIYENIDMALNYSYSKMLIDLKNDIDKMNRILIKSGFNIIESDKFIESFVEVLYLSIINMNFDIISPQLQNVCEKLIEITKTYKIKDADEFFILIENYIKLNSKKLYKKIIELYEACE